MTSQTNEQALESSIEKRLTGTCLEELKSSIESSVGEAVEPYRGGNGYFIGSPNDFNARYAIAGQTAKTKRLETEDSGTARPDD